MPIYARTHPGIRGEDDRSAGQDDGMSLLAYPGDATVPQVAHPALQLRAPPLHGGHIERYALQLEVGVLSAGGAAIAAIAAAAFLVPTAATNAATCNKGNKFFVDLMSNIMD
jgi:hypothetical protein